MRQLLAYIFWPRPLSPQFDYCADWSARAPDNRLPTQNLIVARNVQMFGYSRHAQNIKPQLLALAKTLLNPITILSQLPLLLLTSKLVHPTASRKQPGLFRQCA